MSTAAIALPPPRLLPDFLFARLFLLVIDASLCSHLMTSLLVVNIVDRFTGLRFFVPVTNAKLDFGPWEQIFYGEFDGMRRKRVLIKIIGE